MIKSIFTVDYEVYGNGEGSLRELVYEPAERLKAIFEKWNARFVLFVEVAELEMIEAKGTDAAINLVKHQIRNFYREGFELGLHLHPQWYNARYENGKWLLDYGEYNLCTLPRERIVQIINRSIAYLRKLSGLADFTPFSFRAGNWLFQPTRTVAKALVDRGIKVDSSVFKGGLRHQQKLDYRRALKNGYYWRFTDDVNLHDPHGALLELPIYTQIVPIWKMFTSKRIEIQQGEGGLSAARTSKGLLYRLMDFLRFWYPLKFELGQMTMEEITRLLDKVIREDHENPTSFRPIVVVVHTKDPIDFETVESLLSYLQRKGIPLSTFSDIYNRCTF
ncbi:MAG: hypothetical protein WCC06_12775 [Candidatus Aminicenantales bacterium]